MAYEFVFFDLDGTLGDSSEGITSSVEYALNQLGIFPETRKELNRYLTVIRLKRVLRTKTTSRTPTPFKTCEERVFVDRRIRLKIA